MADYLKTLPVPIIALMRLNKLILRNSMTFNTYCTNSLTMKRNTYLKTINITLTLFITNYKTIRNKFNNSITSTIRLFSKLTNSTNSLKNSENKTCNSLPIAKNTNKEYKSCKSNTNKKDKSTTKYNLSISWPKTKRPNSNKPKDYLNSKYKK